MPLRKRNPPCVQRPDDSAATARRASCRRRPVREREPAACAWPTDTGLTLVELMVSLAIGLFLVAIGSTSLVAQLKENRRLLLEARLMQDLRTAADLITRDLRRDGYWGNAAAGVWTHGAGPTVLVNPYQSQPPASAASDATLLRYSRDAVENNLVDSNEQFGYRLHAGAIDLQLGTGNWQAVTDAGTSVVTSLQIAPTQQDLLLADACSRPCPAPASSSALCPPHQSIRSLVVAITARALADPAVVRSLRTEVRIRNDAISGACAKA